MAEKRTAFPMLPVGHWWGLRKKFKQSIPGTVTASYIASVLDMKETSARANVLPYLQQLGITDDDGKTLDRARQWRDDAQYAEVCKQMREEVYPEDLREAAPGPSVDAALVKRWFANHTGSGEAAVRRMSTFYTVLTEADPEKEKDGPKRESQSTKKPRVKKTSGTSRTPDPDDGKRKEQVAEGPGVHINIQVHVSSDATPDQIDQIFASMAKHIYRKG